MAKPEIRLKGFEGEWQEKELGDISTSYSGGTPSAGNNDYYGGSIPFIRSGEIHEDKTELFLTEKGLSSSSAKMVEIGTLLYALYGATSGEVDVSKIKGAINQAILAINPFKGYDNYFLSYLLKCKKENIVGTLLQGGQGNLSGALIKSYKLKFPSYDEQKAIADYFKSLDSMIQATTKKIVSLKQMKSASFISMFPQAGETIPRVRFKGFEGEWDCDKADNLFKTFNERNRPDLPVLSANQDIRGMAPRSDTGYDISHNKANEVTYKLVRPGQYVIHLRSFQGGFAHSAVEGITSPAYTVFGFKNEGLHDDYFWKIIFMSKEFIKSLETITYGIRDGRSISFSEFSEMNFLFPSKEEQQRIASYFRSLDKQISLQEQRLEKLKQIKAACLDKMFV